MTDTFNTPEPGRRTLCAVLLNPPLRPAVETVSHRNLIAALPLTGCTELRLTNLIDLQSKDQIQLASIPVTEQDIQRSRQRLSSAVEGADEILFAWGSSRVLGATGKIVKEQAAWLHTHLNSRRFPRVWMVAGAPRHPSRWRQFVGPEKQRVQGGSFEERLAKVLMYHNATESPTRA
jgi:hypothetical protein